MLKVEFEHKKTLALNVKIGKYSIPYDQWLHFFRVADREDSGFNFYYYENELKDLLLSKKIIKLERKDEEGIEWYEFRNFKKLLNLKESMTNLFEFNYDDLNADYRDSKISIITE